MIDDWFNLVCKSIPGVRQATVVRQRGRAPMLVWPEGSAIKLISEHFNLASNISTKSVETWPYDGTEFTLCRLTLWRANIHFATAFFICDLSAAQLEAVKQLLLWSHDWLSILGQQSRQQSDNFDHFFEVLEKSIVHEDLSKNAFALCCLIADQFQCEQALFAVRCGRAVRVKSVSKNPHVDRRSQALSQLEIFLAHFESDDKSIYADRFEQWLQRNMPGFEYLVLPIQYENVIFAYCVLYIESSSEKPLHLLAKVKLLLRLLAPVYFKLYLNELFFVRRWQIRWQQLWDQQSVRKSAMTWAVVFIITVIVCAIPVQHHVSAQAKIEGLVQRAVVAPEDGYLEEVLVQAGSEIKKGQLLARLDEQSIRLEIQRWENERLEYEREYNRQLTAMDHAQLKISQAKIAQAQAKLAINQQRLKRSRMLAPIDGIVIKGDLNRSIGAPIKKGQVLFEMAPKDQHKLVLMVDEQYINQLSVGQNGVLRLSSQSKNVLLFEVIQISSIHDDSLDRIRFRVEADIQNTTEFLRPGMTGVGKINVGTRPWVVSLLEPLWQRLRMLWWTWA